MIFFVFVALTCFSFSAQADEPSVKRECKSGFKSYHMGENSRIDACPEQNGDLKLDVTSVGSNYHTCWWSVTAQKRGEEYGVKEGDCELSLSPSDKGMNVKFSGKCRYYCGARASFSSGFFRE